MSCAGWGTEMTYAAYLKSTTAMAAAVGGSVVSLAGGCYGVELPIDGGILLLARCPDLGATGYVGYATWAASVVDADGETLAPVAGDQTMLDIGFIRPRDYAGTVPLALRSIAAATRS